MVQSVSLEQLRKDAVDIFHNGFACSESVIYSIRKNFELDMSDDAFRRKPGEPAGECHKLTNEFADAITAKFGATCCGRLIAPYGDRNSPERKSFCTELVEFAVTEAAKIIAREKGIKAE